MAMVFNAVTFLWQSADSNKWYDAIITSPELTSISCVNNRLIWARIQHFRRLMNPHRLYIFEWEREKEKETKIKKEIFFFYKIHFKHWTLNSNVSFRIVEMKEKKSINEFERKNEICKQTLWPIQTMRACVLVLDYVMHLPKIKNSNEKWKPPETIFNMHEYVWKAAKVDIWGTGIGNWAQSGIIYLLNWCRYREIISVCYLLNGTFSPNLMDGSWDGTERNISKKLYTKRKKFFIEFTNSNRDTQTKLHFTNKREQQKKKREIPHFMENGIYK